MEEEVSFATVSEQYVAKKQRYNVVVRFNKAAPKNADEVTSYLNEIDVIYKRNVTFAIIYDASEVGIGTVQYLNKQVSFMREKDDDTRRLITGCAIVAPNEFARGMISVIFAAKAPACPMFVCSTMEDAKNKLRTL
jgi:hypothetical protein